MYLLRKLNQTSDLTITPVNSLEPEDEGPPFKKFHLLNELIVESQKEKATNVAEMNEVENYRNAKIKIVKDKDYDPLLFWSNNESVYPKLSVLQRTCLQFQLLQHKWKGFFPEQDTAHREGEIA